MWNGEWYAITSAAGTGRTVFAGFPKMRLQKAWLCLPHFASFLKIGKGKQLPYFRSFYKKLLDINAYRIYNKQKK